MLHRRQFLKNSTLVSLTPWTPAFLPASLRADPLSKDDRILVVIQLDGGNDGLNTVVPFADDNYAKSRPVLRITPKSVLRLNDSIGLHPALGQLGKYYKEGLLTIVQGVGYPNPNRSHFDSTAIWHRGLLDEPSTTGFGWLGRAVDSVPKRDGSMADSVFIGDTAIPMALRGRRANAISLEQESDLTLLASSANSPVAPSQSELLQFVAQTQVRSFDAAGQLEQLERKHDSAASYPPTELARHLQLISKLIKLEIGTRIYFTSHSGYDTHSQQENTHRSLLTEFSGALSAFLKDLKASGLLDQVVVICFSEFGRRVEENGSAGTDHGAAGPVFLAGSSLTGGLIGEHPSLVDLIDGDLKMSIDFRSLYTSLLKSWLKIDAASIIAGSHSTLPLFKT